MYTLNCLLSNSIRTTCQQVVGSLNVGGSILGSALQRAACSSAARLQETQTAPSTSATTPSNSGTTPSTSGTTPSNTAQNAKEFSYYPPLPGQDSPLRWAGKKFEELPIAHIKATYNNTHIQMTDWEGRFLVRTSCGTEGFRNVRKATPIAAQTAGISAAAKATAKGVTFVRVMVKGLGPGRLSAIKGLTMGGLEVVSITDNTPVPHNGCRPRKARRV